LAISKTADPLGVWSVYQLAATTSSTVFDQPHLAVSTDKIAISWFEFDCGVSCGFATPDIYVIGKTDIVNAANTPAYTAFKPGSAFFGMIPAREFTATSTIYLPYYHAGTYGLVLVDGPAAAATWAASSAVFLGPSGIPPDALEPDGGTPLNTGDDRLTDAAYRNGSLWLVANDACQPAANGAIHACLRYMMATTIGSSGITQNFDIGGGEADLFYPAIAPNSNGDLSLVFSAASIHQYASLMSIENPSFDNRQGTLLEPGVGAYDTSSCGGVTRWGDYSAAAVDPSDPTQVWVAGEYAPSATDPCNWGTAIARLLAPPKVTGLSPNSGPNTGGTSVTVFGSGFTYASAVNFGRVPVSFAVNSDSSITVSAPAQPVAAYPPNDGMIRVTTPSGTSSSVDASQFHYVWPIPVITGVSPVSGSAAGGTLLTISGTGLIGAWRVEFGAAAVDPTSFVSASDTQIVLLTPPATTGTVDVRVWAGGGATVFGAADKYTFVAPAGGVPGGTSVSGGGALGNGAALSIGQEPYALAYKSGKLYLTDILAGTTSYNGVAAVRSFDPATGTETIIAGSRASYGGAVGDGGPASAAQFASPYGIAVDSAGTIYVADAANGKVREIKNGTAGTVATLAFPTAVAVDSNGTIYAVDVTNNGTNIDRIDGTTHVVTTIYQSTNGSLIVPRGLAVDPNGNLLIGDTDNHKIERLVLSTQTLTVLAGGGTTPPSTGVPALQAQLLGPQGVAMDANGNLFFADRADHRVWKIDAITQKLVAVAGTGVQGFSGDAGPAASAMLNSPSWLALDGSGGLYIADALNLRVRFVNAQGTITSVVGTGRPCGFVGDGGQALAAQLCQPSGMVVDANGNLFIADASNNRIRKIAGDGTISTLSSSGALNDPTALTRDGAGNLLIADTGSHRVLKLTPAGVLSTLAGTGIAGSTGDGGVATLAQLNAPQGVALDAAGNIYISDTGNHRIRKVSVANGTIATVVGNGTGGFTGDGAAATTAEINSPKGLRLDGNGTLYFADSGNFRLRKVSPGGIISTIAGIGFAGGEDWGPATAIPLGQISDVALAPDGTLFVADNGQVRELLTNGTMFTAGDSTLVQQSSLPQTADPLNQVSGVAVGPSGSLYISEAGGSRVDRMQAPVVPGASPLVTATAGPGSATVTWVAPYTGGSRITQYTVTPYIGTAAQPPTLVGPPTVTSTAALQTSVTIPGLNANNYTFAVAARNAAGIGAASSPSNAVTVATTPGIPTNVTAVNGGDGAAVVSWSAPSDGGSPITEYTVTSSPSGGIAGTLGKTSTRVPGLVNGQSYTFIVSATNANGDGSPSTPSNKVYPFAGGSYHPLPPSRILDTRDGTGGYPIAPLGQDKTMNVQITGAGGVPTSGVSAVVLNVTVTNTNASSYLTVFPAGVPRPTASNLNWTPGVTAPNLVEVAVGQNGQVTAYNHFGKVDIIFDVAGYVSVTTNSNQADGMFNPVVPTRLLDTRDGTGTNGVRAPLGQDQTLHLQVTGRNPVAPAGVSAVVLNVTIADPTAASYLTVFPSGSATRPTASNLNFVRGQIVPNRVIVKVGPDGQVNFYNHAGSVNVIADVGGFFTDGNSTLGGSHFVGITPTRLLDTRQGFGPLGQDETATLGLTGPGASQVSAVVLNVTVADTTGPSYLTVWPDGQPRPTASDLNWVAGLIVPNLVVVKVGNNATIDFYNHVGSTDVIVDMVGYYGVNVPAPGTFRVNPPMRVSPPTNSRTARVTAT
ncbi:MAG: hypothetical protein E6I56_09600, partial [Chloroflexi bacterium]